MSHHSSKFVWRQARGAYTGMTWVEIRAGRRIIIEVEMTSNARLVDTKVARQPFMPPEMRFQQA